MDSLDVSVDDERVFHRVTLEKKIKKNAAAIIGSIGLHVVFLAVLFFHSTNEVDNTPQPTEKIKIMKASLWTPPPINVPIPKSQAQPVVELPKIKKVSSAPSASSHHHVSKRVEKGAKYQRNDDFDKYLANVERAVETNELKELKTSELDDMLKSLPERELVVFEQESPAITKSTLNDYERVIEPVVERYQEELVMDPLLVYQQKIALNLQKNLRISPRIQGKQCVLGMELTRDGLVLHSYHAEGDAELCKEAQVAAERVGKFPMPKDDKIYAYLNKLKVTVITATASI